MNHSSFNFEKIYDNEWDLLMQGVKARKGIEY